MQYRADGIFSERCIPPLRPESAGVHRTASETRRRLYRVEGAQLALTADIFIVLNCMRAQLFIAVRLQKLMLRLEIVKLTG
jgi:hypothetical protein